MNPPDRRAGVAVLVTGVGAMLAADVWLMAKGHAPITDGLRTRNGRIFVALLAGHVANVLGPCDPFKVLGYAALRLTRQR